MHHGISICLEISSQNAALGKGSTRRRGHIGANIFDSRYFYGANIARA